MPQTEQERIGSTKASGPALAFFAKVPMAGQVKTRLCPPLTPAEAAGLYRGFLEDLLEPMPGISTYCYGWPAGELDRLPCPAGVTRRGRSRATISGPG